MSVANLKKNFIIRPFLVISNFIRAFSRTSGDEIFIGEVLKRKGVITNTQLQHALALQKEKLFQLGMAIPVGQIIVELGYASEGDLVRAINDHFNISIESLSDNIKGLVSKVRGTLSEEIISPRLPIWLQLAVTMILVLALSIGSLSYVVLHRQRAKLYDQTVKLGMVSLTFFGSNANIPLLEDDILALNTLLKNVDGVDGHLYAFIIDNKKNIKAHTDQSQIGQIFKKFYNVENISKKGDVTYFNYVLQRNNMHVLNLSRPIKFKDKKLGEVHVGLSIDFINNLFFDEREFLAFCTLIIILLGLVVAVLFGLRFSYPISRLVKATREIAKGNYQYKVNLKRNDELGSLAKAFNTMGNELSRQVLMKKSFGKYVGSEVLDMILMNPENTWLKGRKNFATILFADIRGFTAYSETKEPEIVVEKLNEYFDIATRIILKHGGYIDKFIGDAVLGVFGVPVFHKDHTERCIRAAVEMQREFAIAGQNGNKLLSRVGIGIKSGVVVAGNLGSQAKMEYTVIGDCVNIASRLYSFAGSGEIVIGDCVGDDLADIIDVEPLPPTKIKGRAEPVDIYKVINIRERSYARVEN